MLSDQKQMEKTHVECPDHRFPYGERECWEEWEFCQGICFMLGYCIAVKGYSRCPENGNR